MKGSAANTARIRIVLGACLLVGLAFIAYFPALHGGFLFDDESLLTRVQTHKTHQSIAAAMQTEARKLRASLS